METIDLLIQFKHKVERGTISTVQTWTQIHRWTNHPQILADTINRW